MTRYKVQHRNGDSQWFTEQQTINEEFATNAADRLVDSGNYDEVRVITTDGEVVYLEECC